MRDLQVQENKKYDCSSRFVWRYLTLISIFAFLLMAYLYDKKAKTPRSEASSYSIQPTILYKQYQSDFKRISRTVIRELRNQTSNEYIKIPNVFKALGHQRGGRASGMEIVTWCTCCSESYLYNLPELVTGWKGPISVTVFTTVSKVSQTLKYLSALYYCDENIRQRVSFHLCFPAKLMENASPDISLDFNPAYCKELVNFDGHYLPNYVDTQVPFPINFLRNVAIESCKTPYVLNADIDFRPSAGLYDAFVTFVRSHPERSYPKTAFVLPSFETNQSTINSLSKDRLIQFWEKGTVRPFYSTVWYECQSHTDYNRWKLLDPSDSLQLAYHKHWVVPWEPYVVVNKTLVPLFNERLTLYGYNRLSQMCEMYMADFKFGVLNNGFLVHKGFKDLHTFHKGKFLENIKNHQLYKKFRKELQLKYPEKKQMC